MQPAEQTNKQTNNQTSLDVRLLKLPKPNRLLCDYFIQSQIVLDTCIRFIRDHACDGINVGDVLNYIHLSRRTLQSQFLAATGKTPHDMIATIRTGRVQRLLQESELSLEAVAQHRGL